MSTATTHALPLCFFLLPNIFMYCIKISLRLLLTKFVLPKHRQADRLLVECTHGTKAYGFIYSEMGDNPSRKEKKGTKANFYSLVSPFHFGSFGLNDHLPSVLYL